MYCLTNFFVARILITHFLVWLLFRIFNLYTYYIYVSLFWKKFYHISYGNNNRPHRKSPTQQPGHQGWVQWLMPGWTFCTCTGVVHEDIHLYSCHVLQTEKKFSQCTDMSKFSSIQWLCACGIFVKLTKISGDALAQQPLWAPLLYHSCSYNSCVLIPVLAKLGTGLIVEIGTIRKDSKIIPYFGSNTLCWMFNALLLSSA